MIFFSGVGVGIVIGIAIGVLVTLIAGARKDSWKEGGEGDGVV